MISSVKEILTSVRTMTDQKKMILVESILTELDKPDPAIDKIWAEESGKRWKAYKDGREPTLSYAKVMERFKKR